jgi:hypothetical protein
LNLNLARITTKQPVIYAGITRLSRVNPPFYRVNHALNTLKKKNGEKRRIMVDSLLYRVISLSSRQSLGIFAVRIKKIFFDIGRDLKVL